MISIEIKYLLAIKETQNITKAAELLNIAQPSLSRYLKDKEKEMGHPLFVREKSKITGVTDFGKLYFDYAEKIYELENKYLLAKDKFENNKSINLLIPIVISQELVNFIVNIRKKNPEIDFRIATDSMAKIQNKIKEDFFDYAIVHSTRKSKGDICIYQLNTTLVIPMSVQKKYQDKIKVDSNGIKHIDLKDLKNETFYIPVENRLIGKIARHIFDEYDFKPEKVVEWDSTDLCLMMADKEDAICFYAYNKNYKEVHVFLDKEFSNYFYLKKLNKKALDFKL